MATVLLSEPPRTGRLLWRAALGVVLPRRGRARPDALPGALPGALPDTEFVLPDVVVDRDHLAYYARVCGFRVRDELPPTYPHVLAFGLALSLMTGRDFPFPMLGSVHVNNTITQYRPLTAGEPLTLRVLATGLRPHDRGRQFDVVHTAEVDGEPVWRDISTYLRRGPTDSSKAEKPTALPADTQPADAQPVAASARWRVGEDVGRRYAAVSGDRNPIHLNALAAKAFGFRRAIAHGMWTKARCLAALEGRLPPAFTVDVAFKTPVLLPSTVAFVAEPTGDGWRLGLHDAKSGRPHLAGTITSARPWTG